MQWDEMGFDAIWLMGVWSTGPVGRELARNEPLLANEYRRALLISPTTTSEARRMQSPSMWSRRPGVVRGG